MTRTPRFDDVVDEPLAPDERERLERVHELLIAAGPPPELSPQLERGPSLALTLGRTRRGHQRRIALLAAALSIAAAVFLAGYLAGNRGGGGLAAAKTLQLRGTPAAPNALASLVVQEADAAGNWPMRLSVTGLPKLPRRGYYAVYLTRHGKPLLPCGVFVVRSEHAAVVVQLNAPYHVRPGDSWVVTKELPGDHSAGQVVLHPVT